MQASSSDKNIGNQAYPREFRLTGKQDFSRVFKKNTSCRDQYFRIMAQTGNGLGFARLGQVVSRKVDKRAVQRNRIKRLVRESFRTLLSTQGNGDSGIDYVVLAQRQAALEPNNQVLLNSLKQLWQKTEHKLCRENPHSKQD